MLPLHYTPIIGLNDRIWTCGLFVPSEAVYQTDLHSVVGIQGFEPWTSCSQSKRTTRLCYTPMTTNHFKKELNFHLPALWLFVIPLYYWNFLSLVRILFFIFNIYHNLVENNGIEPLTMPCKGIVFPIKLNPHNQNAVSFFSIKNFKFAESILLERVERFELSPKHWQCLVLTVKHHTRKMYKVRNTGFEPVTTDSKSVMLPNYTNFWLYTLSSGQGSKIWTCDLFFPKEVD